MTKKQAQEINIVFANQKKEIQLLKAERDSIIKQAAWQDSLWNNLFTEVNEQNVNLFKSVKHDQDVIKDLEKQKQNTSKLFFGFWTVFVGYMYFIN